MTETEARSLCFEMQKHFWRYAVIPGFDIIADCIEQHGGMLRSSEAIAKKVSDTWKRGAELRRKLAGRRKRVRRKIKIKEQVEWEKVNLDKSRVPMHELEKCPHGVPKVEPCALCMGEKFRQLIGID